MVVSELGLPTDCCIIDLALC